MSKRRRLVSRIGAACLVLVAGLTLNLHVTDVEKDLRESSAHEQTQSDPREPEGSSSRNVWDQPVSRFLGDPADKRTRPLQTSTLQTGNLELLVKSRSGDPVAKARVRIRSGTRLGGTLATSDLGKVVATLAAGRHVISVSHTDYLPETLTLEIGNHLERIERELRLEAAIRIEGRVVDTSGEGVGGLKVHFFREGKRTAASERVRHRFSRLQTTQPDGHFSLGLAAGLYKVTLRKGRDELAVLRDIEIQNRDGQWIRITLEDDTVFPAHDQEDPSFRP